MLAQATSLAGELCQSCGPRDPYARGKLGVVAEGGYADLILANGNPLETIDLIADPDGNFGLVMKEDVIYKNDL